MRFAVFWLVVGLTAPLFIVGYVLLLVTGLPRVRRAGISATAVAPLSARWILDAIGRRPDPVGRALLLHLPILHPIAIRLCMLPVVLGARLSGHIPAFAQYPVDRPRNLWEMIGQRNTFFDRAIREAATDYTQFVHLGAGFDTRTHRLLSRTDGAAQARVFEVDRAPIQRLKRAALDAAGVSGHSICYVEVDFADTTWWSSLENAGFRPDQPTFFLWEGVSYYLQAQDVQGMLEGVITHSAPGSAIAFDYASTALISGGGGPLMIFARFMMRLSREPWTWGLSTQAPSVDAARTLVESCGLALRQHSPYGREGPKALPTGGLVVAVVPRPPGPLAESRVVR